MVRSNILEQASRLGFNSPKDLLLYQKTTTRATFDFLVDIDKIKAEYGALAKEDPRGSLGLEKASYPTFRQTRPRTLA
jgi:hypothetical protein